MRRQIYFESATLAIGELATATDITYDIVLVIEHLKLPENTVRRFLCTQSMDRFHVHTSRLILAGRRRVQRILSYRWRIWAQINAERHIHELDPVPAPKRMSVYRARYVFTRDGIPTSDNLPSLDEARRSLSATVTDILPERAITPPPAAASSSSSSSSSSSPASGDAHNPITITDNEEQKIEHDEDVQVVNRPQRTR